MPPLPYTLLLLLLQLTGSDDDGGGLVVHGDGPVVRGHGQALVRVRVVRHGVRRQTRHLARSDYFFAQRVLYDIPQLISVLRPFTASDRGLLFLGRSTRREIEG